MDSIIEYNIKYNTENKCIGYQVIGWSEIWKLVKTYISNYIYNFKKNYNVRTSEKEIRIMAIDDNEKNYNVYITNYVNNYK